ncbi:hypothetical protein CYMTET_33911, partial [Cymbomonas tetramitiformis]
CRDKEYLKDKTVYSSRPECTSHLDEGYAYAGGSGSGWITFKLPTMRNGDIQVCNMDKRDGMAKMNDGSQPKFSLNGNELPQLEEPGRKVQFHPTVRPTNSKPSTCMQVAVGVADKENAYFSVSVTGSAEFQIAWIIAD